MKHSLYLLIALGSTLQLSAIMSTPVHRRTHTAPLALPSLPARKFPTPRSLPLPERKPTRPTVDTTTEEEKQTTQVAIASVLNIAANVANIVQNPHNSQTVIHGTQGILNSILNIVAVACKRNGTELDPATYVLLLSALEKEIQDLVIKKQQSIAHTEAPQE